MIKLIYLLGFILGWLFFYKILVARRKRFPKLKATIIVLLFSSLVYQFGDTIYSTTNRLLGNIEKQEDVPKNHPKDSNENGKYER
jgi:hypothetical protein